MAQTLLSPYLLSALAKVAGREVPLPKNKQIFKPDMSWLGQPFRTRNESAEPPTLLDPNLTLTRMQRPAMVGNAGNKKALTYAGFANPCNAQQPLTAHS